QPWAQAFRIEKQIADLRWGGGRRAESLTPEQKVVIRQRLSEQETAAFSTLYHALRDAGCMDPAQRSLNLERSTRDSLSGDKTRAAWRSMKLIEQWDALAELQQIQVINFLADLGSPEELYEDDWASRFVTAGGKPRQFDEAFRGFINAVRAHKDFGRLSSMGLESGRSAYSIKALKRITEWLRNPLADAPRVDEEAAIRALYDPKPKSTGDEALLTDAPETGNVVVDVALRQLQGQINRIIKQRGQPPAQIIVEMARQMGLGPTARGDIEKKIGANQKRRKEAADRIKTDTGHIASDRDITRYLLWDEQGQHWCPYCNDVINLGAALDGSQTNIEHILPRKLTRVGGKRSQLVLSHASCNSDKGDRTPFQAFGHIPDRWQAVKLQADRFKAKKLFGKAQLLLLQDWEDEVLDEVAIKGFTDRQFHETSWISKIATLWLRNICSDVAVSRGEMTAYLRRVWGLETVIAEVRYEEGLPVLDTDGEPITRADFDEFRDYWKDHENRYREKPTERRLDKRIDHRHHFIDALTISMTSRSLFQKLATEYRQLSERQKAGERVRLNRYVAPPLAELRAIALEQVRGLRTAGLTHKPDRHAEGLLFQGTAYNRIAAEDDKLKALRQQLAVQLAQDADEKALKKVLKQVQDEATLKYLKASIKAGIEEGLTPVQALAQPAEQLVVRDNIKKWAEDKKLTAEKARKDIEGIVSEATRKIVSEAFEARIAAGKTPQEAFAED
ncbi:MAG: type II CRISPR RNA-guided endonuclease Cas9, partial [Candidatus Saccharimonadales bacterium]